jgi:hypothetical protein
LKGVEKLLPARMRVGALRGWSDPKSHKFGSPQKRTPWLNKEVLSCRWGPAHYRSPAISGRAGSTKALLSRAVVGATGFEPVTSSVSAKPQEPLC